MDQNVFIFVSLLHSYSMLSKYLLNGEGMGYVLSVGSLFFEFCPCMDN